MLVGDVVDRIRGWYASDKEVVQTRLSKGKQGRSNKPFSSCDILAGYSDALIAERLRCDHDLTSRYLDYENMDDYPITASVLTVHADDATVPDAPKNKRLWIESADKDLADLLNHMLHKVVRIEEELWSIARETSKYGSDFEEILVDPEEGVVGLSHLSTPTMRRVEGPRGELYGFVQDFQRRNSYTPDAFKELLKQKEHRSDARYGGLGSGVEVPFEPWQVVHFKHIGKWRNSVYGMSIFEDARWIWKRLILLEDAAWIYRLQRAPERFAFYVGMGNRPYQQAMSLLNKVKNQYRKKKFVDPKSSKTNMKLDTIAQFEDFFVPVFEGTENTRIELLSGPSWQHMEDVEYFLNQLFASLHVPKTYLAQDEGATRASLSNEDARFARTVMRLQQDLKEGIEKICRVHLAALDIPPDAIDFTVKMTSPSAIFELSQIEVENARADLFARVSEFMSVDWGYRTIYGMSEEAILEMKEERLQDALFLGERQGKLEGTAQKYIQKLSGGGGEGMPQQGQPMGMTMSMPSSHLRSIQESVKDSKRVVQIEQTVNRIAKSTKGLQKKIKDLSSMLRISSYQSAQAVRNNQR